MPSHASPVCTACGATGQDNLTCIWREKFPCLPVSTVLTRANGMCLQTPTDGDVQGPLELAYATNVIANTATRTGYVLFVAQQVGAGLLNSELKQSCASRCSHT